MTIVLKKYIKSFNIRNILADTERRSCLKNSVHIIYDVLAVSVFFFP